MDKEPIMIDGVDVSRCKYLPYCNDKQGNCAFEPNCYFKQLARKTQECEELKKEIINKNEKIKELRFSVSDLTNRLCYLNAEKSFRIVDLEQTLDEIEKELKERLVRTEEDLKYQCVDCMNVKSDRYRKALDEIEGYVNSQLDGFGNDVYAMDKVAINEILDIINEAKDGE